LSLIRPARAETARRERRPINKPVVRPVGFWRHVLWRLEYAAVRGAEVLLLATPPAAAEGLARLAARVYFRLDGPRRRSTLENLRVAFPERDLAARHRLAVASFEHAFVLLLEVVRRRRVVPDLRAFRARNRMHGDVAALREEIRAGRGGIFLTAHLGNWEVAGAYLAFERVPFAAISRAVPNPYVQAHLMGTRSGGFEVLGKRGAVRDTVRAVREAAGSRSATRTGRYGVFCPRARRRCPRLEPRRPPGFFALRLRRGKGVHYDFHVRRYEPKPGLDVEAAQRDILLAYHAALEEWIRLAPEQYLWLHRRWKTRPPGEVPGPHLPVYDHRSEAERARREAAKARAAAAGGSAAGASPVR
jgi:KDO2-lipid IV(A) lauroyltransferase